MKTINKLFLYLLITVMVFCQNVFSKSLPPGSGSGDVKANVLILLDTSASMNGNPFGGAAIYNPNDLILLNDGDVMVGQQNGAIVKFDYDTEDFDSSFVDPDGDGKGDRLFQGSNSMPSCELETGRQDSRIRTVGEMDKSSDVNGVSPSGKEVIYSISFDYQSVVAIDAEGDCVEVIDSSEFGKTTDGRFDRLYPSGLDIRTIGSNDHLIVTGFQNVCVDMRRVGKKKKKKWVCRRYTQSEFVFTKNLSTGNQKLCDVSSINSTFRDHLKKTNSISMDGGNNLYYVVNGEIYKIGISSDGTNYCPDTGAPTRFARGGSGNVYNLITKMSIDPQDASIIYATSDTSHTLQKLSINASNITTSLTVGSFGTGESSTDSTFLAQPIGLHVSNDRVWVGNAKNSIQEFDISAGGITWQNELGTKVISRAEGAKRAIKAVVNDSSLTSGAYFGYGYWNAGTVPNKKGAKGKWVKNSEYSCHNMCPKAKWYHRCNDYCDYYQGWSDPTQHPNGKSVQCDDNSCIPVAIGPNTSGRIIQAVDNMKTRFGTDGNAFSQLAYEYMTDPNLGITKDGPECQLNYVIVIGDGMWQHHDRAIAQIKALRTETAAMGVNKDEFGVAHGVKTIFIAYGGGIKDRGDEQFQEAAKAGSCDDPNFGTAEQDPECRQRIIAENPKELVTKLKSEIERIIASRLSFSAPSITATVQEGGDLFQGQFSLSQGQQWIGHLMRKEVTPDGFVIHKKGHPGNWDAAELLAQREPSTRKIWTALKGVDYIDSDYNNWVDTNADQINGLFQILGNVVTDYHKPGSTCGGTAGNSDDISGLINFVRGTDYFVYKTGANRCDGKNAKRDSILGDIYHSQIVEVGPPGANTNYTSTNQEAYFRQKNGYNNFANSLSQRPRTLYVGANDGMLHAFDAKTGEERWAFVPPFIAGKLPEMINDNLDQGSGDNAKGGTNAIFAVDGSPVVHDMFITGLKPDGKTFETAGNKSWHTILMIPYGRGGAGYSILDVTDPLKPLHVFSVYNDFVRSKVMIALHDGTIINSASNPQPALNYTGGRLTINDSEEYKNAKYNIETARADDVANRGADDYTERDKIKDCVSETDFYSTGTAACYKGRVWRFPYIMPDEFVDDPASLPVERVVNGVSKPISVVKIEQEASIATITFGEDLVINLGEGDEKADDESDFFSIKIPNIGTEDPVYDYSKMGETWATPRIFRLPVEREQPIDDDRYVAVMPAGFGKVGGVGSAVYVIDLETMNEQSGGQYPGKIASGGNGLINLVDIDNTFESAYGGTLDDLPNSVLGDPVVITPDTFRGAKWRGALVYVNDYEGKISKINLTNDLTSNDPSATAIDLFDHTTLFSLNTNQENGRVSFFGMDAAFGKDTKNLYLFGATGDFNDISRKSRGMDNILYGIRDFDFPNFRMVNTGASGSLAEAMNARKIDADDGYTLSPNCVNTADETSDQGDCPAIAKDAWVFKLDKPFDKRQDESLFTSDGSRQSTQNLYHKATASPTVFKGTVYYPVYQPPEGAKCSVGNAYVCAADDECGINTSEDIGQASKQMSAEAGFDEKTGCYYLQPGVLSKLVVFADKLFANITTDSDDQADTLISLLSNDGAISVFRGNWRENY
jgi:type IV pilus assembly protein PilY1